MTAAEHTKAYRVRRRIVEGTATDAHRVWLMEYEKRKAQVVTPETEPVHQVDSQLPAETATENADAIGPPPIPPIPTMEKAVEKHAEKPAEIQKIDARAVIKDLILKARPMMEGIDRELKEIGIPAIFSSDMYFNGLFVPCAEILLQKYVKADGIDIEKAAPIVCAAPFAAYGGKHIWQRMKTPHKVEPSKQPPKAQDQPPVEQASPQPKSTDVFAPAGKMS